MNPKISIIIPVYNVEKYISDCIGSIVSQSYQNWELILVDDGSTDKSYAICQDYRLRENRIRLMSVNRGGGVSAARNLGLEHAVGEYVLFVDSDDFLLPDALMHYVDNVNLTNADIVKSGWEAHYYDGRVKTYCYGDDTISHDCSQFFKLVQDTGYSTFIWNTLFSRCLMANIRFDESLCWMEDHIFSYQCFLKAQTFTLIKDITYCYNVRKRISLSSIQDPYIICKAANKEISLKQRILNGNDIIILEREWQSYHSKIEKAVKSLYENATKKRFRQNFSQTAIRASEITVFPYEELFFNDEIPFIFRDTYLLAKTRIYTLKISFKSKLLKLLR